MAKNFTYKNGIPDRTVHDRAAEFFLEVVQETDRLVGITQLLTSGEHPQTDGLVYKKDESHIEANDVKVGV